MTWTNEQLTEALQRYVHASELGRSGPAAVLDYAAELLAANGGTMTANELECMPPDKGLSAAEWVAVRQHIAALGAKVAALTNWLADLTEVLCGERPVTDGVMPGTTLDAAKALRAKVAELRDNLRAYTNIGVEAAQVLAQCGGTLGEGLLAGAQRVVAKVATLEETIRSDREHDALLLAELGGSGETLRGACLRVKRERDELLDLRRHNSHLIDERDAAWRERDEARSELAVTEAERARLAEDAGVTQAMALRRELEEARAELAKFHEAAPHDQETVDQLRADLSRETTNTEVWRQRCEKAADALADVAPGELGRLDLVGRIEALKTEWDVAHAELARLKPSGQVEEDVAWVSAAVENRLIQFWMGHPEYNRSADEPRRRAAAALSRLAALAQRTQEAENAQAVAERYEAVQSERATAAEQKAKGWEDAYKLADTNYRETVEKLDAARSQLRAIRERLKTCPVHAYAEARRVVDGDAPPTPPVSPESVAVLREEQVPNTADGCPCLTTSPMGPDAPCPDHDEAFSDAAAMHPNGSCSCAGEGLCDWCTKAERAALINDGAEAMRAACLKDMRVVFGRHGLLLSGLWAQAKAALEGAAP